MSYKRYPEEFKIEAVKQVTDRGYKTPAEYEKQYFEKAMICLEN